MLRLRNAHSVNIQRLALSLVLLVLVPVATEVDALVTLGTAVALLWAMISYETSRYGTSRYRLRHGLEPDAGAA